MSNYDNINFLIKRDLEVPYEQEGRYQDKNGAVEVDVKIENFLKDNGIEYQEIIGINNNSKELIMEQILKKLSCKITTRRK